MFDDVLPGRRLDHAQVRRHRPGPGDQQAAGRDDGRRDRTSRATPGAGSTFWFTARFEKHGAESQEPTLRSACSTGVRALIVEQAPPTAASSMRRSSNWGMTSGCRTRRGGARRCSRGGLARRALRHRDHRPGDARHGRPRARAQRSARVAEIAKCPGRADARPPGGHREARATRASPPAWPSRCASRCSTNAW